MHHICCGIIQMLICMLHFTQKCIHYLSPYANSSFTSSKGQNILFQCVSFMLSRLYPYNGFSKWLFFGGDGIITENDPIEQEKRIKYNDLITNSIIFQNVVDITTILWQLKKEGYRFSRQDLETLSPYMTRHIKRFGDYVIDLQKIPHPIEETIPI